MSEKRLIGNDLFIPDNDSWFNACLNFADDDWDLYAEGYLTAAEIIAKQIINDAQTRLRDIDGLIYPLIFLYRHFLEVRIKQLIIKLSSFLGLPDNLPQIHKLDELWKKLEKLILQAELDDEKSEILEQIGKRIHQFAQIDPTSQAFRYPEDKARQASLPNLTHINVRHVYSSMKDICQSLDGMSLQIDYLRDCLAETYQAEEDLREAMLDVWGIPSEYRNDDMPF